MNVNANLLAEVAAIGTTKDTALEQLTLLDQEAVDLRDDLSTLKDDNEELLGIINGLDDAQKAAEAAALIEDYFAVNTEAMDIPENSEFELVTPFCIAGPSVLLFQLSVSIGDKVNDSLPDFFGAMLLIGGQPVASTAETDTDSPSNLSLIYRGKIAEPTDVVVVAMVEGGTI